MVGGILARRGDKIITIGTGLTDAQRIHPPKIGTRIKVAYQSLTKDGMLRFPVYKGLAI
jgi:DNA ligase-1